MAQNIQFRHMNDRSDKLLFVTITLNPKLYKYQSLTQYELTVNDIETYFRNYSEKATISTELTNDGNVHYHAIAKFRDKLHILYFINSVKKRKSLGYIKITGAPIESIDQLQRASIYLVKDLTTTMKIICRTGYNPELIKYT